MCKWRLNWALQTDYCYCHSCSCLVQFAALLNVFTYPWEAQSSGNCMFMAQITQTGQQQETLFAADNLSRWQTATTFFQWNGFADLTTKMRSRGRVLPLETRVCVCVSASVQACLIRAELLFNIVAF